jgi:hypothetical protein
MQKNYNFSFKIFILTALRLSLLRWLYQPPPAVAVPAAPAVAVPVAPSLLATHLHTMMNLLWTPNMLYSTNENITCRVHVSSKLKKLIYIHIHCLYIKTFSLASKVGCTYTTE